MSEDEIRDPEPTQPILDLRSQLQQLQRAEREAFQREIAARGGAEKWFRSVPMVLEIVRSLTGRLPSESALTYLLLLETQAFWTGIETRLGECARCPPEGGACDGPAVDRLNAGRFVRLEILPSGPVEHASDCERYKDFRMSRRLEASGVARALSRTKLLSLSADPKDEILLAFNACLEAGVGQPAPRNVALLIEGVRAREYGAALLRAIVQAHPSLDFRSEVTDSLVREWKEALTTKEANPIRALLHVPVLVLDGIDSRFLKSEKVGLREVQWLYKTRRDQGLCTIITALCPAKEAFPDASVLRV